MEAGELARYDQALAQTEAYVDRVLAKMREAARKTGDFEQVANMSKALEEGPRERRIAFMSVLLHRALRQESQVPSGT